MIIPLNVSYDSLLAFSFQTLMDFCRWWDNNSSCQSNRKDKGSGTKELDLFSIAGVFVIIAAGAIVSFTISIAECQLRVKHKLQQKTEIHIGVTPVCESDNEEEEAPKNQFGGYSVRYRKRMSVRQRTMRKKVREEHPLMGNTLEVNPAHI